MERVTEEMAPAIATGAGRGLVAQMVRFCLEEV